MALAAALAATPPGAALLLVVLGLAAVAAILWRTDAASWLAAAWVRRRLEALQFVQGMHGRQMIAMHNFHMCVYKQYVQYQ